MLTKLKIYTAVSLIIGLFAALLFGITVYSVYDAVKNNNNFKRIVVASENNDQMRDAVYNISAVMANTNGLMLQAAMGNPVSQNVTTHTQNVVKFARRNMDDFMASPFNTPEESRLAAEVNAAFNEVYKAAEAKLGYLNNPTGYTGSLEHDMNLRTELRNKVEQYTDASARLNESYIHESERGYKIMLGVGLVVILLGVGMLFAVRFWLRNTLVRRMETTVETLRRVAAGDLSQAIESGSQNEIGSMLSELETMRTSLTCTILGIRESVQRIHSNAQKLPTVITISLPVRKSRRPRCRRQRPAWSRSKLPCVRMPITRMRPVSWRKAPVPMPITVAKSCTVLSKSWRRSPPVPDRLLTLTA